MDSAPRRSRGVGTPMSLAGSQQKVFLRLLAALRPHWHRDQNLPGRLQAQFAANRSFGSRDRKLYRELVYTTLRFLPWIEPHLDGDPALATKIAAWLAAELPATRAFRAATCGDWPPCPPSVAAKAAHLGAKADALLPPWAARHCPEAAVAPNLDALHTRAPLWLRLQLPGVNRVLAEFTHLTWPWQRSEILPNVLELRCEADVTKTAAWSDGLVEVQDLGSQLILESAGIEPGGHWLDACAGAGGKTLQLATLLGPAGRVDAHDIRLAALRELEIRAARAGYAIGYTGEDSPPRRIAVLTAVPERTYDGVLVDAPCSGSGTWRRAPHLKWTTSAGDITRAAEKQLALLMQFAGRVRPGGRLVYATCSLSRIENEEVVAAFVAAHDGFEVVPPTNSFGATARTFGTPPHPAGFAILPATHNTDGFFFAMLRRR